MRRLFKIGPRIPPSHCRVAVRLGALVGGTPSPVWKKVIFVEANPDIDGLDPDPLEDLRALAASSDIGNLIDWPRVKDAHERKDDLAPEVTIGRVARGRAGGLDATSHPIASLKPATSLER
jgi:hypothetical protein